MQGIIDRPDKEFLSAEEAAAYVGIGEDLFLEIVRDEADWMHPVLIGKKKKWAWDDVWCLRHMIRQRRTARRRDLAAEKVDEDE